ncbi:MAG: hypothetical protein ACRYFS_20560 [Janthinobacterium lividum]
MKAPQYLFPLIVGSLILAAVTSGCSSHSEAPASSAATHANQPPEPPELVKQDAARAAAENAAAQQAHSTGQ